MAGAAAHFVKAAPLHRWFDAAAPLPFEEALVPIVERATEQMSREAGGALRVLSAEARTTLERALLQIVSRLAFPTLQHEFSLARVLDDGDFPWDAGSPSTDAYVRFIKRLDGDGLEGLLRAYPLLTRHIDSWTQSWARSHARMLRRLKADFAKIQSRFGFLHEDCLVTAVAPYRSDPHGDGDAVTIIALPRGNLLVYKPRPLDMETGFADLLEWVNSRGVTHRYRTTAFLPRDDYGWMEYVAADDCHTVADVEAFYVRAGGLLCLLYFLQATDIHRENLIAAGSQPVVVDLETLFHPRAANAVDRSVLRDIGMLPSGGLDFSALGSNASVKTPFRVVECHGVNSDAMSLVHRPFLVPRHLNVPHLDGLPRFASEFVDCVVEGFREVFMIVLRNRAAFAARLDSFAGRQGRRIARSSNDYGLLIQDGLRPLVTQEPEEWKRLLDQSGFDAAERLALACLSVPYFAHVCDPADAIARLRGTTEADLAAHLDLIRRQLANLHAGVQQ